jgi:hypothetical protein
MTTGFRVLVHRSDGSLHLKLIGDFDSTSADELFRAIKQNGAGVVRVFVHTSSLRTVHPSGRSVISHLSSLIGDRVRLILTGENITKIASIGEDSL